MRALGLLPAFFSKLPCELVPRTSLLLRHVRRPSLTARGRPRVAAAERVHCQPQLLQIGFVARHLLHDRTALQCRQSVAVALANQMLCELC